MGANSSKIQFPREFHVLTYPSNDNVMSHDLLVFSPVCICTEFTVLEIFEMNTKRIKSIDTSLGYFASSWLS